MAGEADSYYNADQRGAPQQYGQQPPQYQPQYEQQYQQPPPPQQPYPPQNGNGAPMGGQNGYQGEFDEKHSFDQQFKIEKPKWNDLWAGILVGRCSLGAQGRWLMFAVPDFLRWFRRRLWFGPQRLR